MRKLEKLSWEGCREELREIAEGRSDLSYEKRERLFAKTLMLLMDRASGPASEPRQ